ncbi:MAG: hypothetical protein JWO39_2047 [Gemmatimonadetes bacterium]|nr:hypothetical protein [Gemmatimonadota bacterium]
MFRRFETALLIMIAATATGGATHARAISGTCAPKDERSERLLANFKAFVGKTDMGGTIEKTTMGVASVTPSEVVLVTDKALCTKAAAAINKEKLEKHSSYTLYVVTLGSSYGVEDTKVPQAGFEVAYVFDKNWKYIGVRGIHS